MSIHPLFKGCLTALVSLYAIPCSGAPLITEFLASNTNGLRDEDNTLQDWIEIYNPDAATVNLAGYSLTDDSAQPVRWTFPSGVTLAPNAYLVVFASGKDRRVAGQNLHTNFSLSAGGEFVGLYAPGGTPPAISSYAAQQQSANISYGLLNPVAGSPEGFFTIPTPGAPNNAANSPAPPVQFSTLSKTFNQGASFNVTLTTSIPAATIRYTTNLGKPVGAQGIMGTFATNATTEELTLTGHGFSNNDEVQIEGVSVANLGQSITYFVTVVNTNVIKLSEEPGDIPVDITAATNVTLRRNAALMTASTSGICTSSYHTFRDRDPVQITTTGTLPGGLAAGTTYYVSITPSTPIDFNNYRLSATPGGTTLPISTTGTGVHTIRLQPSAVYTAPLTVNYSQRIRARAFLPGQPDGPAASETYLALDAAAQTFTSNIPVMILHSWGSNHPSTTAPGAGTPEDSKDAVWFLFEPKLEGASLVTRLTNVPDLVTPAYFERRGSSTFGAVKYSMTMGALNESNKGKEVSPLGYASNDDFVLNAHYEFDRSLMHNDLAYRLSNECGRWAPRTRHVEVFMSVNNDFAASGGSPAWGLVTGAPTSADYYGIFSFQDKISRGSGRLDIEKVTPQDNTAPNVQGGYIFKIDRLDAGDAGLTMAGRAFALVQPKEFTSYPSHLAVMTPQQKTYLQGVLNAMYTATTGASFASPSDGYAAHFDMPATIDHHILSTLPKSLDAFRLSGYWHKSRFGKLVPGPVFDFDRSMGSTDARDQNPVTWRGDVPDYGTNYFQNDPAIYSPNYYNNMFLDPNFWVKWIDRLNELRQGPLSTAHILSVIDDYTELLDPGNSFVNPALTTPAKRNFQRFTGAPPRNNNTTFPGTNGSFRGEAAWLKNWWTSRLNFIDGQFSRPPVASPAIPAQPHPNPTPVTLTSPTLATPGAKIYYTTNGTDPRAFVDPGSTTILTTWLTQTSAVKAIVPDLTLNNAIGTTWRGGNEPFDDSTWYSTPAGSVNGVGYDNSFAAGAVDYQPFFRLRWNTPTYWGTTPAGISPAGILPVSVNNVMMSGSINGTTYAGNSSCYIRYAFTVPPGGLSGINMVRLRMRYDDGFHAFLNGASLGGLNTPGAASLVWNSTTPAAATHDDTASTFFENLDVMLDTLPANTLKEGTNIVAIQGLNANNTSSDFVQQAEFQGGFRSVPNTNEISPAAIEYTGALSITQPTKIFARTWHPNTPSNPTSPGVGGGTGTVPNGSRWSAKLELYIYPGAEPASPANLRITELLYHPAPPSADEITLGYTNSNDFEFIRLTNIGAAPIDLTGIYFSNGLDFTAVPSLANLLAPGASVVIVENLAAFTSRYGNTFTVLGEFSGELDDGGEHIVLNARDNSVIADFIYGDSAPWPVDADNGYSLLYASGDQTLPGSWRSSVDLGGSAVTSFGLWQTRYFSAAETPSQGLAADLDTDGLNNLGEYAFGTNPRLPGGREAAAGVSVPGNPPGLAVRRRRGAPDLTWTFEVSSSLTPGTWTAPGTPPVSTVNNGDGTETVTWLAPAAPPGTRVFMRARVTSP